MKTIGIKLADGSFYPVLKEGSTNEVVLDLTTANNNQTKVMVDLYRSKTNSMDDAEYVDSLQIDNLNEHPNGEPVISFTVSVDENNELHASIVDTETGASSNSTITLVSRTIEERLVPDEYNVSTVEPDFEETAAVAAMATGVGLLAAAESLRQKEQQKIEADETETPSVEAQFIEDDLSAFGGEADAEDQKASLESFFDTMEETEAQQAIPEETETPEEPAVETPEEPATETEESAPTEFNVDFPEDSEAPAFELPEEEGFDIPVEESSELPDMSFDMPEEPAPAEIPESENTDLPDMDFDMPTEENTELPDMDFDMPTEENTDLPDMDFDIPEENADLPDMDFDLPDLEDNTDSSNSLPDDFFNMEDELPEPASAAQIDSAMNFEDLYSDNKSYNQYDETKKKTKTPVIICVICAIICIIAVALLLFVLPTKYNLISNGKLKPKQKTEKVVKAEPIPEPTPEPEPVIEEPEVEPIPEAKEDEIIIIEKAEEVIPLPPPVAEKPKDIMYKIKWGDTLWDISDTYYKNPWRYKYLARYNGIKDPDYIISGTIITIPAE